VRHGSVRLLDHDYLLAHVPSAGRQWGIETVWRGEVRLCVADPARTVVDILDAPRLGGGIRHVAEILAAYLDDNEPATLIEYGDRLGNRIARKRSAWPRGTVMIPAREILNLRAEWSLDVGVIEKDYVLGWLLAGIANHPKLSPTWVFKGGTCLRKCSYETYRFSEDLDFTVVDGGPETPEDLAPLFREVGGCVREKSGIDLVVEDSAFRRCQNRRGNPTTQGRIAQWRPEPAPAASRVEARRHGR